MYIYIYVYNIFFIHLFISEHLECFYILVITDNAKMNTLLLIDQ